MTVESRELFELCKQVYEATEWESDGEYVYHHNDLVNIVQGKPAGDYWENNWWFPLYTSDYLLEKLAKDVTLDGATTGTWQTRKFYRNADGKQIPVYSEAETPLKALLKLTLRLHEEKIL